MKQKDKLYLGLLLAAGLGIYWWQKSKENAAKAGYSTGANTPVPKVNYSPPPPTTDNVTPLTAAAFANQSALINRMVRKPTQPAQVIIN
jgi:hypothetical protein